MKRLVISEHARFEMQRRAISEQAVRQVAVSPQQVVSSRKGREVRQSQWEDPKQGRTVLLRVVVQEREGEIFVVTAYKTSKIQK